MQHRPCQLTGLTEFAHPTRVIDADFAAWRTSHPSDADLVGLLALGAMGAVDRIRTWVAAIWHPSDIPTAAQSSCRVRRQLPLGVWVIAPGAAVLRRPVRRPPKIRQHQADRRGGRTAPGS